MPRLAQGRNAGAVPSTRTNEAVAERYGDDTASAEPGTRHQLLQERQQHSRGDGGEAVSVPLLPPDQEAFIDAVARRVIALLDEREPPSVGLVDARTLARMFGMSVSSVHEHADELGAVRLGVGARPLVRFEVEQARAAWTRRVLGGQSHDSEPPVDAAELGARRRGRNAAARPAAGLLPVKDRHAA